MTRSLRVLRNAKRFAQQRFEFLPLRVRLRRNWWIELYHRHDPKYTKRT